MRHFSLLALATLSTGAVAQQDSEWTKQQWRSAFLMGLSFPSRDIGYIVGGTDGLGYEVCRTDDGAQSWPGYGQCGNNEPAAFLFDLAFERGNVDTGVMTGVGLTNTPLQYTENGGETWTRSENPGLPSDSQDVEVVRGANATYAAVGSYGSTHGVAVSRDGGHSFEAMDWGFDDRAWARYGSFPTPETWYISGGRFPTEEARIRAGEKYLTDRVVVNLEDGKYDFLLDHKEQQEDNKNGYFGVIQKSNDAGRTWQTVHQEEGELYFNNIACPTVNSCWVVGENSQMNMAAVLHTNDGGATWTKQLEFVGDGVSLMAVECLSERECWVGGGRLVLVGFRGLVWHTVNAGQDWELQEGEVWENSFISNMDFVDASHGYATALHRSTVITEIFSFRPSSSSSSSS